MDSINAQLDQLPSRDLQRERIQSMLESLIAWSEDDGRAISEK